MQIHSEILENKGIRPSVQRVRIFKFLVQVLDFGRGVLRYDADLSPHSHFECERCGAVYDLDIKPQDISKKMPRGFKVHQTYFYVFGLCSHCKKNEKT